MFKALRRLIVGPPIATERSAHERVGVLGGLAVFASDGLSSVAYGPEEILLMLVAAGAAGLQYTVPVALAIALVIGLVATSYRQTVMEYPSGGGAYVVARDNLGTMAAHVAGAALLTDYVLTVAVSVAAGVAAVTSAWPTLFEHRVAIAVGCVFLIMLINLRGVRESAAVFALPVYSFIVLTLGLVCLGLWKSAHGALAPIPSLEPTAGATQALTTFLLLRAFSSGCASVTGIEAVANGVQAFRKPEGKNAAAVLGILAVLLATMVVGVAYLAHAMGVTPVERETVVSQIGRVVFGQNVWYFLLQLATALILILAANTSFAGFPRLAAFMAEDGYLPRQMMNLGDRLVYQNGIIILAGLAAALIVAFGGEVSRLIPLYAVGVFTAFTASQAGMVVHWLRKGTGRHRALVNGIGALATAVVTIVIATTKFVLGAWIVCIVIPVLMLTFRAINRHYRYVASRLTLERASEVRPRRNLVLLLVGGMHRGTLEALEYVKTLGAPVRAVHVEVGGEARPRIQRLWDQWEKSIPLIVLPSPYRNVTQPLLRYIQQVRREEGYDIVTVVLPEFVVDHWWESLLHNHSALWLQVLLSQVPGVAVLNMRYKL